MIDQLAIEELVSLLERDPTMIPQPIGPRGYMPPEHSVDGPAWGAEYLAAVRDAEGDLARLRAHPRFREWDALTKAACRLFRTRHPARTRVTWTAAMETRQRVEEEARERGEDIHGSAYHLDLLTPAGRRTYWRRLYRKTGALHALKNARDLEKYIARR